MPSKPKGGNVDQAKIDAMQAAARAKRDETKRLKDGVDAHAQAGDLQQWVAQEIAGVTNIAELLTKINEMIAAIDSFSSNMGKFEQLLGFLRFKAHKTKEATPEMAAIKKQLTNAKSNLTRAVTALKSIEQKFSAADGVQMDIDDAVEAILKRVAKAAQTANAA